MKMTKKAIAEMEKENAIRDLDQFFHKYGFKVYTELNHVSRSGMLRRISCYIKDENGALLNITSLVAKITVFNEDSRNKGLRVTGCGMDMGFHVVYSLSCAMYCKDGYSHDSAYKVKQEWI